MWARENITKKTSPRTNAHHKTQTRARFLNQQSKLSFVITENCPYWETAHESRELRLSTSAVFSVLTFFINHWCVRFQENCVQKSEFYIWRMSQRRYVNLRSSCWCRMEFHKEFFAIWTFEIIIVNWSSKILFHFSTIKHDILNCCSQFYISISHHISDTILLFSKSLVWISFVSQFFTWTEIADVLREKNSFLKNGVLAFWKTEGWKIIVIIYI